MAHRGAWTGNAGADGLSTAGTRRRWPGTFGALGVMGWAAALAACPADGGIEPSSLDTAAAMGALPGSACRPAEDPTGPCDQDLGGVEAIDMRCVSGTCLVDCSQGGTFLCRDLVADFLTCSKAAGDVCVPACADGACEDGFACLTSEGSCLPQGSFPGSPCDAASPCGELAGAPMQCVQGLCLVPCEATVQGGQGGQGDATCQAVDPSLTCSVAAGGFCVPACQNDGQDDGQACDDGLACLTSEGSCLPQGSFPGSPCDADSPCGELAGAPMQCVQGLCLVPCDDTNPSPSADEGGGDATCQAVDPSLTCSGAAGGFCVPACGAPGECPVGLSCLSAEGACLPLGTFPGALCRPDTVQRCDQNLQGQADLDLTCVAETCQVDCTNGGATICGLYAAGLGLPPGALACHDFGTGSFCAQAGCSADANCPPAYTCDLAAGHCLPYKPVHIIHTNDLHSHFDGIGPMVAPREGGYPQLAAAVRAAQTRADARGAVRLTLDGGDWIMGTTFHMLGGMVELDFLRYLGFDATTVGNHELDWGPAQLATQILPNDLTPSPILGPVCQATGGCPPMDPVPVLLSGVHFDDLATEDDALAALYDADGSEPVNTHPLKRFVVLERQGVKVGIFGLIGEGAVAITPTAAPLAFDPLAVTAQELVDMLRAPPYDVDLVIACSHAGSAPPPRFGEDERLAEEVEGIDVIVSGHTHELVAPKYIHGTYVVQAWEYGRVLGELELGVVTHPASPRRGRVDARVRRHTFHAIDPAGPADPVLAAARAPYVAAIDGLLAGAGLAYDAPLGAITEDLVKTPGVEHPLGDLIADANRLVVSAAVATSPEPQPVDVAIEADGVIRDDIVTDPDLLPTPVWLADAFAAEPLGASPSDASQVGYPMVTIWLTADELRQILEVAATLSTIRGDDFWLSVSGLTWRVDPARPAFQRVTGLWLAPDGPVDACDEGTNLLGPDLAAKDPARRYRVAANLYVAGFAELLGTMTQGVLAVTPKDASGEPVSVYDRIVPDGAGGELRQWTTLATHLGALATAHGGLIPAPTAGRLRDVAVEPCP